MDIRKYSFVNRTIQLCNKLPVNALGTFPFKLSTFRKTGREVISEVKGIQSKEENEYFQENGLKCGK
jgi:hypothetical protein